MPESELSSIGIRIPKDLKDRFLKICEEEGIDPSQGMRELIAEALARGYINKERKEIFQKIKNINQRSLQ
jgi:antitoxin component of RelBE/YafQ-DinJ toxin-antitoxin module